MPAAASVWPGTRSIAYNANTGSENASFSTTDGNISSR